ncbi:MAG: pilus assembly protein [Anaerolineales bacterium]|nr:pilus assembly protein [Anaerolineales bacterium]
MVIGVLLVLLAICVLIPLCVIVILALLGPAIGNVFSNIILGL